MRSEQARRAVRGHRLIHPGRVGGRIRHLANQGIKMKQIFPPTDHRAGLPDTVAYLRTIGGDAGRLARALSVHRQRHAGDDATCGALSRFQTAAEDFSRVIDHAITNMSVAVLAAIERSYISRNSRLPLLPRSAGQRFVLVN